MNSLKVFLEHFIVEIVLWVSTIVSSLTDMAFLMIFSAMGVEFIVSVKSLATKSTFGMAFETGLVYGSRIIVAKFFVLAKLTISEELMLVSKHLLIPRA